MAGKQQQGSTGADFVNPLLAELPEGATVVVKLDGAEATVPVEARQFKTGSVGYFVQGKVAGAKGRRYQLNLTATLIGSKPEA